MLDRSKSVGWGGQVVMATEAGLFFLLAAVVGPAALLGFIDDVVSKTRPVDWRVGTALLVVVCLGGAAALVGLGLSVAGDVLPPRWIAWRPLRYALTAAMIPVLAVAAIPLLPITFVAAVIVRIVGPILDRRLTNNCLGCAYVRSGSRTNDDQVSCKRHDRFFGGDAYRLFLSNEGE